MKRKKATAGEINGARVARAICRKCASCKLCVEGERSLVRAIARERRKERERCISCVRGLTRFWDNTDERDEVEEMLDRIIDDINEGSNR